jgi:IS30 family transposase
LALHNKKIKARRNQVASLLSKSFNETEIAQQLGVDQSTISRDIKVLKESAQQFVTELAKSDLAYYYKQSIDGIEDNAHPMTFKSDHIGLLFTKLAK